MSISQNVQSSEDSINHKPSVDIDLNFQNILKKIDKDTVGFLIFNFEINLQLLEIINYLTPFSKGLDVNLNIINKKNQSHLFIGQSFGNSFFILVSSEENNKTNQTLENLSKGLLNRPLDQGANKIVLLESKLDPFKPNDSLKNAFDFIDLK